MPRLDQAAELIGEATHNPQARRLLEETVNYVGNVLKGQIKTGPSSAEAIVNGLREAGISVNGRLEDLLAFDGVGANGLRMQAVLPKDGGFLQIGSARHPEVTANVRGASLWPDSRAIGTSFDFSATQDAAIRRLGDLGLRIRPVAPKAPTVSFAERNKIVYAPALKSEYEWVPLFASSSLGGQSLRSIEGAERTVRGTDQIGAVADSVTLRGVNSWLAGKPTRVSIKGLADNNGFDNHRDIVTRI